jgi:dTDP-4-amino-4,6-dideoxy-D-galactose acyltransferase
VGSGPCDLLAWDTAFWGAPIARVRATELTPEAVGEIDAWCADNRVACLCLRARPDDPLTVRLAEANSFRFVDVRLVFGAAISAPAALGARCDGSRADESIVVRRSRPEDVDALALMAADMYQDTRFYYDEGFPRQKCSELYQTWIRRSCEDYADAVLVAELESRPVGYITCHLERQGSPPSGNIGLVGVGDGARGRGVGSLLVDAAIDWFRAQGAERATVVTQVRNLAAQRLYQRCGLLTESVQLWYHKWYRTPGMNDE